MPHEVQEHGLALVAAGAMSTAIQIGKVERGRVEAAALGFREGGSVVLRVLAHRRANANGDESEDYEWAKSHPNDPFGSSSHIGN